MSRQTFRSFDGVQPPLQGPEGFFDGKKYDLVAINGQPTWVIFGTDYPASAEASDSLWKRLTEKTGIVNPNSTSEKHKFSGSPPSRNKGGDLIG